MTMLTRLERWDPFNELATLRNRMDQLWSRMTADEPALANWSPTSDVMETKDDIVVKAELPGIDVNDIDVQIENGVLSIQGQRSAETDTEDKGFRRLERTYGTFFRSFVLPPNVQVEKIAATFANGLLELRMPKKEEAKPRSIKVDVKKQLATAT